MNGRGRSGGYGTSVSTTRHHTETTPTHAIEYPEIDPIGFCGRLASTLNEVDAAAVAGRDDGAVGTALVTLEF
jgi:hypothetical protein